MALSEGGRQIPLLFLNNLRHSLRFGCIFLPHKQVLEIACYVSRLFRRGAGSEVAFLKSLVPKVELRLHSA